LQPVVKGNPHKYLAQVFQALRIEVNDELGALQEMLNQLPRIIKKRRQGGNYYFSFYRRQAGKNFLKMESPSRNYIIHLYIRKKKTIGK